MSAEQQPDRHAEHEGTQTEKSFWEAIGLPEPSFIECENPPEVEHDLLRRLVRKELSERSVRMTYRLVFSYKNWFEAFKQVVGEEASRWRERS